MFINVFQWIGEKGEKKKSKAKKRKSSVLHFHWTWIYPIYPNLIAAIFRSLRSRKGITSYSNRLSTRYNRRTNLIPIKYSNKKWTLFLGGGGTRHISTVSSEVIVFLLIRRWISVRILKKAFSTPVESKAEVSMNARSCFSANSNASSKSKFHKVESMIKKKKNF